MSDEMIRALAANGGVIMINFGSSFLRSEYQAIGDSLRRQLRAELEAQGIDPDSPEGRRWMALQRKRHPIGTVADVADHIDHVVQLVGVDHVGLGSDFDGVFALPEGLQDVSMYPNLVAELLRRGYSEEDIEKNPGRQPAARLGGRRSRRRRATDTLAVEDRVVGKPGTIRPEAFLEHVSVDACCTYHSCQQPAYPHTTINRLCRASVGAHDSHRKHKDQKVQHTEASIRNPRDSPEHPHKKQRPKNQPVNLRAR